MIVGAKELKEFFKRKNLISQKFCQVWREIHFTKFGKICFPEDILEHIVLQTKFYSNRDQNNPHFMVLNKEMRLFLGVLLLTGYHSLAEEHHYLLTQPDLGIPVV